MLRCGYTGVPSHEPGAASSVTSTTSAATTTSDRWTPPTRWSRWPADFQGKRLRYRDLTTEGPGLPTRPSRDVSPTDAGSRGLSECQISPEGVCVGGSGRSHRARLPRQERSQVVLPVARVAVPVGGVRTASAGSGDRAGDDEVVQRCGKDVRATATRLTRRCRHSILVTVIKDCRPDPYGRRLVARSATEAVHMDAETKATWAT